MFFCYFNVSIFFYSFLIFINSRFQNQTNQWDETRTGSLGSCRFCSDLLTRWIVLNTISLHWRLICWWYKQIDMVGFHVQTVTAIIHTNIHINFTLLFLSSLWSDLIMWGHFLTVLNLRNPNLISGCATECGNAH